MSSSWKLDASQTTVAAGSSSPASEESGVPTLPATATGSPAVRYRCPSSSTVVVLPLVPVTATNRFGIARQASSSSPDHVDPPLQRSSDHRRLPGHPGALDDGPRPLKQGKSIRIQHNFDTGRRQPCRPIRMPRIDPPNDLPPPGQQPSHSLPRPGQPNNQKRPLGQGRARLLRRRDAHAAYLRPSGAADLSGTSAGGRRERAWLTLRSVAELLPYSNGHDPPEGAAQQRRRGVASS